MRLPIESKMPLNGVIPYRREPTGMRLFATGLLPGSASPQTWTRYVLPADDQANEPSCVGRAWAGWMEAMIRRYTGHAIGKRQIDASAIWKRGRRMFFGGDLSGGLYLDQGGAAAIDLGILPPGTRLARVAQDWASAGEALAFAPLIQAHEVGPGWYTPSTVNGCLDHTKPPDGGRYGYHCTLLLERTTRDAARWMLFQNSWRTSWAYHGFGVMSLGLWSASLIPSGLWTAIMPDGWEAYDGWRKWLVQA